jgi:hypothetical protein
MSKKIILSLLRFFSLEFKDFVIHNETFISSYFGFYLQISSTSLGKQINNKLKINNIETVSVLNLVKKPCRKSTVLKNTDPPPQCQLRSDEKISLKTFNFLGIIWISRVCITKHCCA